jgi:hypothetical protein
MVDEGYSAFLCPKCRERLEFASTTQSINCPYCDHLVDVQAEISNGHGLSETATETKPEAIAPAKRERPRTPGLISKSLFAGMIATAGSWLFLYPDGSDFALKAGLIVAATAFVVLGAFSLLAYAFSNLNLGPKMEKVLRSDIYAWCFFIAIGGFLIAAVSIPIREHLIPLYEACGVGCAVGWIFGALIGLGLKYLPYALILLALKGLWSLWKRLTR